MFLLQATNPSSGVSSVLFIGTMGMLVLTVGLVLFIIFHQRKVSRPQDLCLSQNWRAKLSLPHWCAAHHRRNYQMDGRTWFDTDGLLPATDELGQAFRRVGH